MAWADAVLAKHGLAECLPFNTSAIGAGLPSRKIQIFQSDAKCLSSDLTKTRAMQLDGRRPAAMTLVAIFARTRLRRPLTDRPNLRSLRKRANVADFSQNDHLAGCRSQTGVI